MTAVADEPLERRQIEKLVLELSHSFNNLPADQVGDKIGAALGRVAAVLAFETAAFVLLQDDGTKDGSHTWTAESAERAPRAFGPELPWSTRELQAGRDIEFHTLADIPNDGAIDLALYRTQRVRSLCTVPISVGGRLSGVLSLGTCSRDTELPRWLAPALRLAGEVFCGALLRARAARTSLDIGDVMRLLPAAADFGVWELADNDLRIDAAARALLQLEGPVTDIEALLRSAHVDDGVHARRAIDEALRGRGVLDLRYRVLGPGDEVSWVAARGRIETHGPGGPVRLRAVVINETAARQAQAELEQQRNELSHLNRLAMLSYLSGSFAHELKQPLTAILSNAQAGLRFLKATFIDRDELQEILADIVKEDERAGEVIRRLQALFQRGESVQKLVNLNEAAQEVLGLLHSDLVGRSVVVSVALDQRLPMLLGDRVQLQQVILNLIVNASEAMANNPRDERILFILTERVGIGTAKLSVVDNGRGIPTDNIERVFEPFFTTKPGGTGLGLVICRKIINAHRGRLWAQNNATAGATFSLELPASIEHARR